jgi:hypothetical protein
MKRVSILVLCAAQWVSVSCFNSGCRSLGGDWVTTPMYFELAPNDIAKYQREAFLSGDGEAAYRLYLHYALGFSSNKLLAFYWLRKSGALGHEAARQALVMDDDNLKNLNDNHVTFPVYSDRALRDIAKYQKEALLSGDGEAAYRLYLYYRVGGMIDDARAAYWLQKSGENGYGEALHELGLKGIELGEQTFEKEDKKTE